MGKPPIQGIATITQASLLLIGVFSHKKKKRCLAETAARSHKSRPTPRSFSLPLLTGTLTHKRASEVLLQPGQPVCNYKLTHSPAT